MFLALIPAIIQGIQEGAPAVVGLWQFFRDNASEQDIAVLNAMLVTDAVQKAIILHELAITAPSPA